MEHRYTLRDVWNAMKTERHFDYVFWIHITLDILTEFIIKQFGRCLIVFACVLILLISVIGFFIVIPAIARPWTCWFAFNCIWGLLILYSITYNYFKAVVTKPGNPTELHFDTFENCRQCKKCNFVKPPRTHHCSICNSCVMKMDHHCPWIGNCVGLKNYRYFVCFLLWVTLGTSYVTIVCTPTVFSSGSVLFPDDQITISAAFKDLFSAVTSAIPESITYTHVEKLKVAETDLTERKLVSLHEPDSLDSVHDRLAHRSSVVHHRHHPQTMFSIMMNTISDIWVGVENEQYPTQQWGVFIAFILCIGVTVGTGGLLSFHLYLISTGQTTIEFFENQGIAQRLRKEGKMFRNPFNRGFQKNFAEVFGNAPWYIAILPLPSNMPIVSTIANNNYDSDDIALLQSGNSKRIEDII